MEGLSAFGVPRLRDPSKPFPRIARKWKIHHEEHEENEWGDLTTKKHETHEKGFENLEGFALSKPLSSARVSLKPAFFENRFRCSRVRLGREAVGKLKAREVKTGVLRLRNL